MFFHFGPDDDTASSEMPLACLGGGIMVDSGSEGRSYLLTCQDRYPVYAALSGMRSLLFVRDDEHVREYQATLATVARHLKTIEAFTGPLLDIRVPEPLFVGCDIDSAEVSLRVCQRFLRQIHDPEIINARVLGGIYLNQISPIVHRLVTLFYDLLRDHGIDSQFHPEVDRQAAQLALHWHEKSRYVELLRDYSGPALPPHVPTAMIASSRLQEMSWEELLELVERQTGSTGERRFFVKSAMDSAGEVCVVLNRQNFQPRRRKLMDGLARKVREKERADREVYFLVQPCIERATDPSLLPSSVGFTYYIHDHDHLELLGLGGHLYEDSDRSEFLGIAVSKTLTRQAIEVVGEQRLTALFRAFAHQGLRGPVNLDAVRNAQGEYVFIYDCNPRLSGMMPALVVEQALERAGYQVQSILTLGHKGRLVYEDLAAKLSQLRDLDLLYTGNRQRGVLLLPSLVRRDSFDLILVNMEVTEVSQLLASGLINELSDERSDLGEVFL
jgi:hypothetical protein